MSRNVDDSSPNEDEDVSYEEVEVEVTASEDDEDGLAQQEEGKKPGIDNTAVMTHLLKLLPK